MSLFNNFRTGKLVRRKEVLVRVFAFNKESAVKIAAEKRAMELSKRGYV